MTGLASSAASRTIFNIMSLGPGLVGLPLLILAIVFGRTTVKRSAVYLNFIVTVVILGISFSLLTLAGQQDALHPKSRTLCYAQTALVDGSLAMTPVSTLLLLLQLGGRLQATRNVEKSRAERPWMNTAVNITFLILPYIALAVFSLRDLPFFNDAESHDTHIDVVNPAFYCKLATLDPVIPFLRTENPLVIFIATLSCLTIAAEVFIAFFLWREWNNLRVSGKQENNPIPLGSLLRLAIFTLYRIAIVVVAIAVVRQPRLFPVAEFLHGAIPMVVFIVFGLQKDILSTWLHWLKTPFTGAFSARQRRETPRLNVQSSYNMAEA